MSATVGLAEDSRPGRAQPADRAAALSRAYAVFFLVAFGLSVVMLLTDTNLRTDFGAMPNGYFLHWWVVLVTAVADLVGAALLLALASRLAIKGGVLGSTLLAAVYIGVVFTYSSVGFASAYDFAEYLFGVTYSGGDIRYLYDAVLAVYLLTAVFGAVLLGKTRVLSTSESRGGKAGAAGADR